MKKKIFITLFAIISSALLITLLIFINTNNKNFKYFKEDNNYELYLENAKIGSSRIYNINKKYKIRYDFKKLEKEALTYDIYVNNTFLTSTTMVDYTNSEFDVDSFYQFGNSLVYFSTRDYIKDNLYMYVINDTNITKLEAEFDEIKGLRLNSFYAEDNSLIVIASRRDNVNDFTYGTTFNICEDKKPKGFNDNTIIERTYIYSIKDNKLNLEPKVQIEYTYKEYLKEGDEIVCE